MSITAEIAKEFRFEAAHFLPNVPIGHKCHKMHGHGYKVTLRAHGTIDEKLGWVIDLADLSTKFAPLLKLLDHCLLNDIDGLKNPTSENLAVWILKRLGGDFEQLSSVTVEATARVAVTVRRQDVGF